GRAEDGRGGREGGGGGEERRRGLGSAVEQEGAPWPGEVESRAGRQVEEMVGPRTARDPIDQQLEMLAVLGTRRDGVRTDQALPADRQQAGDELPGAERDPARDVKEQRARLATVVPHRFEHGGALLSHGCPRSD